MLRSSQQCVCPKYYCKGKRKMTLPVLTVNEHAFAWSIYPFRENSTNLTVYQIKHLNLVWYHTISRIPTQI